ncbi:MAG: hypothetical protein ACXWCU_02620 [Caldimonas sp.]
MIEALRTIAIRLALCAAATWVVWRLRVGPGVLFMSALFGLALARPLLELGIGIWHEMRRSNWRELEGRHFAFKGRTVRVVEDADHQRWVRLADIRAIAGFTASDAALQITYPGGWSLRGRPPEPHLSDEALLAHLAKERGPEAVRLRQWVEREIVFPARRQRERFGVRLESLDFRRSGD